MIEHDDWSRGEPRILAQRCNAGHAWYLPRLRCPKCGGEATSFEPGKIGTIVALTKLHRRTDSAPEVVQIALVDLDDGVRLMTRASGPVTVGSRITMSVAAIGPNQTLLPNCEVLSA